MRNAFSLMEMMVVLLIVAIVAAATAPMVTKKMARNAGSGDSPWVFTGLGNNIAYNMNGGNATAIIGGASYNAGDGPQHPRLFINTDGNADHASIVFGSGGNYNSQIALGGTTTIFGDAQLGNRSVGVGMGQSKSEPSDVALFGYQANASDDHSVAVGSAASTGTSYCIAIGDSASAGEPSNPDSHYVGGSIAIGGEAFAAGHWSIALGNNAGVGKTTKNGARVDDATAIGVSSRAKADHAIALGDSSEASGEHSTAIGHNAKATGNYSIAIGGGYNITDQAYASAENAIAIGNDSCASDGNSTAIGANSLAQYSYSTAINGARTTASHQIVLGTKDDTVYIPGKLMVGGNVMLASNAGATVFMREGNGYMYKFTNVSDNRMCASGSDYNTNKTISYHTFTSDRRLKNVGEKYTAGLDELKKLEFFHYTFKKDENKTPMVGVMAQDLQKVFPDAVTKGEDGYLRIRLEDMFYAVINAVKELDSKIAQIVENVNNINSKIEEQQKVIDAQQNRINELEKQNADFEKRLAKLEKKNKIVE